MDTSRGETRIIAVKGKIGATRKKAQGKSKGRFMDVVKEGVRVVCVSKEEKEEKEDQVRSFTVATIILLLSALVSSCF